MSKEYPIELITTDRPNRFQVNPVTPNKKINTDDVDTEPFEEDTFDDDDIVLRNNRRSSRYAFFYSTFLTFFFRG